MWVAEIATLTPSGTRVPSMSRKSSSVSTELDGCAAETTLNVVASAAIRTVCATCGRSVRGTISNVATNREPSVKTAVAV